MVMLMVAGAFSMVLFIWGVAYIQAPISGWLDRKFDNGFLRLIPMIAGVQSLRTFWWTAFLILSVYFFMLLVYIRKIKRNRLLNINKVLF
jgi:hypothetical protein